MIILLGVSSVGHGQDLSWPQFRGPNGVPVSANAGLPKKWSTTENVEWVTEIHGAIAEGTENKIYKNSVYLLKKGSLRIL